MITVRFFSKVAPEGNRTGHPGGLTFEEDSLESVLNAIDSSWAFLEGGTTDSVDLLFKDDHCSEAYKLAAGGEVTYDDETCSIVTLALINSRYELYQLELKKEAGGEEPN